MAISPVPLSHMSLSQALACKAKNIRTLAAAGSMAAAFLFGQPLPSTTPDEMSAEFHVCPVSLEDTGDRIGFSNSFSGTIDAGSLTCSGAPTNC